MRRLVLLVVALLGLLACGDTPREAGMPEADAGDCGAYVVTNDDEADPPADRVEKQQCLLDAFAAGDRAQIDVELTTVEGDPVYFRYTVVGRRVVEVRTDTTDDPLSTPAITTERCTDLSVVDGHLTAGECTAAASPAAR
jgi:hypothetical protein